MKARDYLTEIKPSLIDMGYIIVEDNSYKNAKSKLTFKCIECNETYKRSYMDCEKSKPACKKCKYAATRREIAIKDFESDTKLQLIEMGYEIVDYSNYQNRHTPITFMCKCGREFKRNVTNIATKGTAPLCPHCLVNGRNDYTDIKQKLIDLGYIIISRDEEYKNMTTNISFKCNYCEKEYLRTPKMALRSNYGCTKCIQKKVVGKLLSEQRFNSDEFFELYKNHLIDLEHIEKSIFTYKCEKCNSSIVRKADIIKTTTHKRLCDTCGKRMSGAKKIITTQEKNKYLKHIGSQSICIDETNVGNKDISLFKCSCGAEFKRKWNVVRTYGFHRCNKCSKRQSYGEQLIEKILNARNIYFESEKRFENCRNKYALPFDFYLPHYNLVIEYDGIHHFEDVRYEGQCKQTRFNDEIKDRYCEDSGIRMLRIPYFEKDNIEKIIVDNLYGNTEPSQVEILERCND